MGAGDFFRVCKQKLNIDLNVMSRIGDNLVQITKKYNPFHFEDEEIVSLSHL